MIAVEICEVETRNFCCCDCIEGVGIIAQNCGVLAGLDGNIGEASRMIEEAKVRCDRLVESCLTIGVEKATLIKMRNSLVNAKMALQDLRPIPKQIQLALTIRERGEPDEVLEA